MGFPVGEFPACYNGTPTGSIIPLTTGRRDKPKSNLGKVNKITATAADLITGLARLAPKFGGLLLVLSVMVTVFYAMYMFNLWQVSLQAKDKVAAERQARIDKVAERRRIRKKEKLEKELEEKRIELENTERDLKDHREQAQPLSDDDKHVKKE